MTLHLLAISGSLRAASSNTAVLRATARLAPVGVAVDLYADLGQLPHFNPDLDTDVPPAIVGELRRRVGAADGLLISSPEYAHGIAGAMKNALDWLVGSEDFPGKPVAVLNATQRAHHADAQLREILATMSARLVGEASVTLPLWGRPLDAAGLAEDPEISTMLQDALAAFVAAIPGR